MALRDIFRSNTAPKTSGSFRASDYWRAFGGFFRQAFTSFRGNRDVYTVYGYKKALVYEDLLLRYYRQDVAARIVKQPANGIWSYPPIFKDAAVQNVIDDLVERLDLWQKLNRCDRIAAMSPYSAMLIGYDDGMTLDQPVNPDRPNKVTFLQPYSQQAMSIASFVNDPSNARFAKPEFYNLNNQRVGGGVSFSNTITGPAPNNTFIYNGRVHWSRIAHIAENLLEDEVFGAPRLHQVFNLLDDFMKVGGGSAEVYWLNSRGGLHIDIDKDMDLDPASENDLTDEIDDYSNNLRRVIRTRGAKVTPVNMTVADPRHSFDITMDLLAANTGIPQRMLVGSEAGQLASEQDRANWSTFIGERRKDFAEPCVLRPFFMSLVAANILPLNKVNATFNNGNIVWPEAFQMSPLERSQTSAQQARSAANLSKTILATPALISVEEAQGIIRMANTSAHTPSSDSSV